MSKFFLILNLLFFNFFGVFGLDFRVSDQTCTFTGDLLDEDGYFNIGYFRNQIVKRVIFENNGLDFIPEVFDNFPNLNSMELNNQNVVLGENEFNNASTLETLHLKNNKITLVARDSFSGAMNLVELNLEKNEISNIDEMAFRELSKLEKLYLNKNQLQTLPPKLLYQSTNLQNLYLNENQIKFLDKNFLKNNNNLEIVWLDQNRIKRY